MSFSVRVRYSQKEMRKIICDNGYREVRRKGSHTHYKKDGVQRLLTITSETNQMVFARLIKEHKLIVPAKENK